jgi:uncharacterized protein with PIN domain
MPKKPIPMPVADRPDYPSLEEQNTRRLERMRENQANMEPCFTACPSCGSELALTKEIIRPTAWEPTRPVVCPNCGWSGRMVSDY